MLRISLQALRWCTGALTVGAQFTTPKPWTQALASTSIVFTFYWRQQQGWEGVDFTVDVQNA
jgi:hypothetical protein